MLNAGLPLSNKATQIISHWTKLMEYERLIPFLHEIAWPFVALVLAPFVILRVREFAKIYSALTGPEFLSKLTESTEKMDQVIRRAESLNKVINTLSKQNVEKETDEIDVASATFSQRSDVVELQEKQKLQPTGDVEAMYGDMQLAWNDFIHSLGAKLSSIGKTLDARSVGASVAPLADRRRAHPLDPEDVSFIANLHSQVRRFNRLQSSKSEWLTSDIYSNFLASVEAAKQMIAKTNIA